MMSHLVCSCETLLVYQTGLVTVTTNTTDDIYYTGLMIMQGTL